MAWMIDSSPLSSTRAASSGRRLVGSKAAVPQRRVFFVMRSRGESMSGIVGYARTSARERNSEVQEVELRAIGPVRVFMGRGESRRMKARL